MKILIYRWNSYNQKDIEDTFIRLGNEISILDIPMDSIEEDFVYVENLFSRLKMEHFDFVFSINYFPVLAEACKQGDVMYVCWNCDSSLLSMYHESVFYDTNYIFTFDYSIYKEFKQLGCENIFHLPLAGNTSFLDIKPQDKLYDISFVGSLYKKNSYDAIADKLPDYLCGYLEGALYAQTLVSGGNIIEKLLTPDIISSLNEITDYNKSEASFADIGKLFSSTVLGFKAASMQRIMYLNHLSEIMHSGGALGTPYEVHLFTDDESSVFPFIRKHGRVDYFTQMPYIFANSRINLNITIPNIKTGLSLRVWDILNCHGFLMTDYRAELTEYFVPDKDIVIYEDGDELSAKAEFYLKNESLRQKIVANAYDKVRKYHTCEQRLKKMLEIVDKNTI